MLKILEAQFQKKHYSPAQATAVLSFDTESVRAHLPCRPACLPLALGTGTNARVVQARMPECLVLEVGTALEA